MPEFCSFLPSSAKSERKLKNHELIRAIRFMIAAEYEAVGLYMQLHDSTENPKARILLKDIANEERVHAGEFLHLLQELSPDEGKYYQKGAKEAEELLKKSDSDH